MRWIVQILCIVLIFLFFSGWGQDPVLRAGQGQAPGQDQAPGLPEVHQDPGKKIVSPIISYIYVWLLFTLLETLLLFWMLKIDFMVQKGIICRQWTP